MFICINKPIQNGGLNIMKLSIILFLLISAITFSEDFSLFEEFDNNLNNWHELKNNEVELKVENGYYNIEHKQNDTSWLVWQDFDFKTKNIFGAEANIKYEKGDNDSGYGIYIEIDDGTKITQEINNAGNLCFYTEKNDNYDFILDWTKFDIVKSDIINSFLFLMEKEKGIFFLNGYEIGWVEIDAKSKITKIGIKVNGKLKVNIDSIKIYGEK